MFLRSPKYFLNRFYPKQELAWLGYKAGKDLVLPMGRRTGKSNLFGEIQVEDVEDTGYPSLFVAKTQRQARSIIWPKLQKMLLDQDGWKSNESRLEFVYKKGPGISIKGADLRADDLAGGAYRTIACDEFALWTKPDIKPLILAPMLVDYNGQFLHGSTKRGKNHFYKLHQEALKNPDKYLVVEGTMFDNPFLSQEGRERVIQEYPGGERNPLYRQEVLNEYVVFEGMVFALDESTYIEDRWQDSEMDFAFHWRGMDHGYSPDPTAAVWIAYSRRKGHFQIYSEYEQNALLIKTHADAIRTQERWPIIDTISDIDPQLSAEYDAVGLSLTNANKVDKQAQLLHMVNALRIGRLKVAKNCTQILEKMQSLTWEQVEKDEGDDHLIDAARYGYVGAVVPTDQPRERDLYPNRIDLFNNDNFDAQDFG